MYKRTVSLFLTLCLLFTFIAYRIISLNYSDYSLAGNNQSTKTLTVGKSRGTIYDINFQKLVNEKFKKIAVAVPSANAVNKVSEIALEDQVKSIEENLSCGFPCMFEAVKDSDCEDIKVFEVPVRYSSNQTASNIIGYLDGEGNGAFGIEKAYNELLSESSGEISVTMSVDAKGRMLNGISMTVNDSMTYSNQGVVLTIDKEIQKIANSAMNKIESGACVVLDCSDGSISALVSTPAINPNDMNETMKKENSPFVNKALTAYSVGSVFKPILTAYALENHIETEEFNCQGKIDVNGTVYGCINRNPHGEISLAESLQVSCNTFYINLTENIEAEKLYSFCSNFYFGTGTTLAEGLYSADGYLPDSEELENRGNKANFSFGQGKLMATPLQMASAYLALVNGGVYKYPYLVAGTIDADGVFTKCSNKPDSKIIKESTSKKMREILESVVTEGNAYYGEAKTCTTGGKTGTAQSGSYNEDGEEILRTWFVGFFPANEPLYVVAILNENGVSGGKDCGPVFSEIADGVTNLLIERAN